MKNRFKLVSKDLDGTVVVDKITICSYNFLDKFIKETMTIGLRSFIYQDKGGVWKQIG